MTSHRSAAWLLLAAALALSGCPEKQSSRLKRAALEHQEVDAGNDEERPVPANATLLATKQNVPQDLHLDGDSIYWLNEGRRVTGAPGIFKMSKSGGAPVSLYPGKGVYKLALDDANVYFIVPEALGVYRVPKAGGETVELAKDQDGLSALAVDGTHVYWAGVEAIWRVPKAGGKAQTLASNISVPMGFALDGSYAWWYSVTAGKIARVSKKGGAATSFGGDDLTFHAFFADDANVYWSVGSEKKAQIKKQSKSGGKPMVLATGLDVPGDFCEQGTDIFWTTGDAIYRVGKGGGAVTKVVDGTDRALSVAADANKIYWTDRMGRIQSVPR